MAFSRCPKCGLFMLKGATECRSCAEELNTSPPEVPDDPKPVSAGCIVGLVLVCAAAMGELYVVQLIDGAAWIALLVSFLALGALFGAWLSRADVSPRSRRLGGDVATILGVLLLVVVTAFGLVLLLGIACALFIAHNFSSM